MKNILFSVNLVIFLVFLGHALSFDVSGFEEINRYCLISKNIGKPVTAEWGWRYIILYVPFKEIGRDAAYQLAFLQNFGDTNVPISLTDKLGIKCLKSSLLTEAPPFLTHYGASLLGILTSIILLLGARGGYFGFLLL